MKKAIVTFLLLSIPVFAVAKGIGYGNTEWGMNPNTVVSIQNGKAHIIEPKEYTSGLAKVKIEDVKISNSTYTVSFIFDTADKLIETNLTSNEKSNIGISTLEFNNLNKLLTQKYGKPQFEDARTVTWKTKDTTIELQQIIVASINYSRVNVTYSPNNRIKEDTSNL